MSADDRPSDTVNPVSDPTDATDPDGVPAADAAGADTSAAHTSGADSADGGARHKRRREIASPGIVRVEAPTEEEIEVATERRALSKARRGAAATVLAAGMIGLRDALEGSPNDDPAIVLEAPSDPLRDDEALEVRLGDGPTDSEVVMRPWLADDEPDADAD